MSETGIVPCNVGFSMAVWEQHGDRLEALRAECPHVNIGQPPAADAPRAAESVWRDPWGCLWHFPGKGLDGQVIEHPLDSWDQLAEWRPPSATERIAGIQREAENGKLAAASLEHGFLFLRLTYLRGFGNCLMDIADEEPRIYELRDTVAAYWLEVTRASLDLGATRIHAADDLGLQDRLPIHPDSWRRLIRPAYARIFGLGRERGAEVALHTDGYIVDIMPDLLEVGVTILNPQDLVNGLDTIERELKGKAHINLDIDRQRITAFGTPEEVDAHIRRCIRTLGSPEGGLSLIWGVYESTPIENIEAAVRAMEDCRAIHVR